MCGRYRLSRRKQLVEEYFDSAPWEDDWNPRYNIAPTQPVPVVRQHPKEPVRQISLMCWGLIPSWAKDPSGAARMINARSETAATKPAFRDPLRYRRCLIPADGFYEWQRTSTSKQPFCFEVGNGGLFAFAGLWERWRDPSGQWVWPTVFGVPLTRVDASTNKVIRQWVGEGGDSLRCGFGSIWITDYKKGLLSRIALQQVLKE
jgi:putative SOS response-associated peptidase YedK